VPSPPCEAPASPPPPEIAICAQLCRDGKDEDAMAVGFDLLRRCAKSGRPSAAAPALAKLLLRCHTSLIEGLSQGLGTDVVSFVAQELSCHAAAAAAAAAAAGGGAGGAQRPSSWVLCGPAGGGASGAGGARGARGNGGSAPPAAARGVLGAAGAEVSPCRLLEWIERAVQLRRKGGADLVAPSASSLKRTLRSLSASEDPSLGVHAAKLSALLHGQKRPERPERPALAGWNPHVAPTDPADAPARPRLFAAGGAGGHGGGAKADGGGKPLVRRSLYSPSGRGKGAMIGTAAWASEGFAFDALPPASPGDGASVLRELLERDRHARVKPPPFSPSSAWLD
jgi:hypothetical protein